MLTRLTKHPAVVNQIRRHPYKECDCSSHVIVDRYQLIESGKAKDLPHSGCGLRRTIFAPRLCSAFAMVKSIRRRREARKLAFGVRIAFVLSKD